VGDVVRKWLGILVLIVGVGGLGLWARAHDAHEIEARLTDVAAKAIGGSVHGVASTVSGRDIVLTGLADTETERVGLMAAADAVVGRRLVIDQMQVLAAATPYMAGVTKAEGGALMATGSVPSEAVRADFADAGWGDAAKALTLASGAPEGWVDLAKAGLAALGPLEFGQMVATDTGLMVSGTARSPVEYAAMQAALAGLPEGAVTQNVTMLDDGTPAAFTLDYNAFDGAMLAGKLPPGLDKAGIVEAMGLKALGGEVVQGVIGAAGDVGVFASLSRWLPDLEKLRVAQSPDGTTVEAEVGLAADLEAVRTGMTADLGEGVGLTLTAAAPNGTNGQERVNAASGINQRYGGGFWLPIPEFTFDKATCQAETEKVLGGATITFVTGSDALDPSARAILNSLASVMAECARATGLRAIIGGHTDSSGNAQANLGLSQRRATAVRLALVQRGVSAPALVAIGYGDQIAVADNATDEGKARNRRTTVEWVE
jgi:outer membrane protein OmpA-like peptidoglycan-associated protein